MRKKLSPLTSGWLYFFIHFSVEVACFYFLYTRVSATPLWAFFALLYDAVAFVLQSVFGAWLDKHPYLPLGFIGCLLVILAMVLPIRVIAVVVIGVGNAFIHIDGAKNTLYNTQDKITPNAVFVGGGSFGVVTGQLLALLGIKSLLFLPIGLMVLCAPLCLFITKNLYPNKRAVLPLPTFNKDNTKIADIPFTILVVFAVAVRSYIGYAIPTAWNKEVWQTIMLFSAMGVGKMLGGVSADTLGFRKTSYISLLLSLPFLLFGNSIMALSLIGVLLFSMTMPLTVGLLCSRYRQTPCFAFGLTTVGLFLGVTPAFFITLHSLLIHQIIVLILSVLTLACLLITIKENKEK